VFSYRIAIHTLRNVPFTLSPEDKTSAPTYTRVRATDKPIRKSTSRDTRMETRSDILIFGAFHVIVSRNAQSSHFHLFKTKNVLRKVVHVKRLC